MFGPGVSTRPSAPTAIPTTAGNSTTTPPSAANRTRRDRTLSTRGGGTNGQSGSTGLARTTRPTRPGRPARAEDRPLTVLLQMPASHQLSTLPAHRQGHALSSGLRLQDQQVLTCRRLPDPGLPDGRLRQVLLYRVLLTLAKPLRPASHPLHERPPPASTAPKNFPCRRPQRRWGESAADHVGGRQVCPASPGRGAAESVRHAVHCDPWRACNGTVALGIASG